MEQVGYTTAGLVVARVGLGYLGHVGEPLQESEHTLEVIAHRAVGHTVVVHDLHSTQLVVGGVHLPAQHLGGKHTPVTTFTNVCVLLRTCVCLVLMWINTDPLHTHTHTHTTTGHH